MGNEAMTLGLEWTRMDEFRGEPLHVWTIKGNQIAGLTRSGGGLTFATIVGAGHMVRPSWLLRAQDWCCANQRVRGRSLPRLRTTNPPSRLSWQTDGWPGKNFEES